MIAAKRPHLVSEAPGRLFVKPQDYDYLDEVIGLPHRLLKHLAMSSPRSWSPRRRPLRAAQAIETKARRLEVLCLIKSQTPPSRTGY